MFVTKRSLPRRTFLSGMGVAVGLPLLEAMVPAFTALAQTAAAPKPRFGAVYFPNGAIVDQWIPEQVGAGFEFKPILKPLEPFRDHLRVISGLNGVVSTGDVRSASDVTASTDPCPSSPRRASSLIGTRRKRLP